MKKWWTLGSLGLALVAMLLLASWGFLRWSQDRPEPGRQACGEMKELTQQILREQWSIDTLLNLNKEAMVATAAMARLAQKAEPEIKEAAEFLAYTYSKWPGIMAGSLTIDLVNPFGSLRETSQWFKDVQIGSFAFSQACIKYGYPYWD